MQKPLARLSAYAGAGQLLEVMSRIITTSFWLVTSHDAHLIALMIEWVVWPMICVRVTDTK